MARSTMAELIDILRGMTDSGTSDYTIGTATFWDDGQLQRVLDKFYHPIDHEQLTPVILYVAGGSVEYYEYRSCYSYYEATNGGSSVFVIRDSVGSIVGTALYTPDYQNGIITFGSDTSGSVYYLTGRSYDINSAAAYVWRSKASHYATSYDVGTSEQSLKRSQMFDHCSKMADRYESMSMSINIGVVQVLRSDDNAESN